MTSIAGHHFTAEGRCSCQLRFADISGATTEHVGKPHWAHQGALTTGELLEIQAEVARIWGLVQGSATGNGPAAVPADMEIAAMEAA